ncbi:mCG1027198, isoform CRA_b [Mus musculus]|nr:mCG1027198, isoform CRA_b [Mus musculus]
MLCPHHRVGSDWLPQHRRKEWKVLGPSGSPFSSRSVTSYPQATYLC